MSNINWAQKTGSENILVDGQIIFVGDVRHCGV